MLQWKCLISFIALRWLESEGNGFVLAATLYSLFEYFWNTYFEIRIKDIFVFFRIIARNEFKPPVWKFWAAYAVKYFIVDYEFVAKKDYDITLSN